MAKSKEEPLTKEQALETALQTINKKHGSGSAILGGNPYVSGIDYISSGSLAIDIALCGGFARGRVVELIGKESGGKSSCALHLISEAQKLNLTCAYIDAEHALLGEYAKNIGVDLDKLIISQPNSAEEGLDIVDTLVRSGALSVIVIDSVAALVPQKEIEGDAGTFQMGLQARLMSQAMRKLSGATYATNCILCFINQIRMKTSGYGNPEESPGGLALRFFASQRIDVRRSDVIKSGETAVGITSRVKVIKNKIGPPFREVEIDILFGKGIDRYKDIIRQALKYKVIDRSGAWYSYKGERVGQGEENAADLLREKPELADELYKLTLEAAGIKKDG